MRKIQYGAAYLASDKLPELSAALEEKILFRYSTDRRSSADILEEMVRSRFGSKFALATTNGTQSLRLALLATRPKIGDKVYIPAITFIAAANAALSCGLIPVLVDVDQNYGLDVSKLPSEAERVVICHLDGHCSDLPARIPHVIEDAAQALGARDDAGLYVGTKGSVGIFSFQHSKILSSGQGGLVTTNNEELYRLMRNYHDHGVTREGNAYPTWPSDCYFGENMIASELQTSVQVQQMNHLEEITAGLERGYEIFQTELSRISAFDIIRRPRNDQKTTLRLLFGSAEHRTRAIAKVQEKGLVHWSYDRYFLPDHPILRDRQSIYGDGFPWNLASAQDSLWERASFDVTKERVERTLCLPIPPEQSAEVQSDAARRYRQILSVA